MTGEGSENAPASDESRRLYIYNGGFLTQPRLRRILTLAGYEVRVGLPGPDDLVGVWGQSPTAPRGEAVAGRLDRPVVRVEDPFIRSVGLGRDGALPIGLLIDRAGLHFASDQPSDLEMLLARHPLDDGHLLSRARDGMGRMKASQISKYNGFDPDLAAPEPGYVLVIDQTEGDASVTASGATAATFREMLVFARAEHPGARILIKTHPETAAGHRPGYYSAANTGPRIALYDAPVSPWRLMDGAIAVYTVSSQLGFEAIFAGHRPRVFGKPFYGGWGLTDDENPVPRRSRKLTRAQLFAGAMILYPTWYDPCRDRLCSFEDMLDQIEAEVRAFRDDRAGYVAGGMRLWKRPHLQRFFGREKPILFEKTAERAAARAQAAGRAVMLWGLKDAEVPQAIRVEDGFLRSRGLGADLVPPLSLITDRRGLYYDPTRPSDLEALIAADPPPGGEARAERLIRRIVREGATKYNLANAAPLSLPEGHRILVPGQVEDDASLLHGAGEVRTNAALLKAVRTANPDALIFYKPHPDVEAQLRAGGVDEVAGLADHVLAGVPAAQAIEAADEVWTMTSTLGFEALLRGKPVTCLGTPFYAGWGLTRDLGDRPARRRARPSLAGLIHACLIAYPRYLDPVSNLPCPPEVILDRLRDGYPSHRGPGHRLLSKVQGIFASQSWLWR